MLERHVTLRDGEKVLFRPLKPEDAALYPDFLAEVTREDLRLRFFAAMREVSPALIDKLIHYDPAHAMAFVAIEEGAAKCSAWCGCTTTERRRERRIRHPAALAAEGPRARLADDEAHDRLRQRAAA